MPLRVCVYVCVCVCVCVLRVFVTPSTPTLDACMSYEEDTCMSYEEEDTCMSYEEEDACMSYESASELLVCKDMEEDTCEWLGSF